MGWYRSIDILTLDESQQSKWFQHKALMWFPISIRTIKNGDMRGVKIAKRKEKKNLHKWIVEVHWRPYLGWVSTIKGASTLAKTHRLDGLKSRFLHGRAFHINLYQGMYVLRPYLDVGMSRWGHHIRNGSGYDWVTRSYQDWWHPQGIGNRSCNAWAPCLQILRCAHIFIFIFTKKK